MKELIRILEISFHLKNKLCKNNTYLIIVK